jgi:hypothetical protein
MEKEFMTEEQWEGAKRVINEVLLELATPIGWNYNHDTPFNDILETDLNKAFERVEQMRLGLIF